MSNDFVLEGQSVVKSGPYFYKGCGLDGIHLLNGYAIEEHDGEQHVTITNIEGLHCAIGKHLVMTRKALNSKEIRFLRNTMGLTQAELGQEIGKNSQAIARWEKGEVEIPTTAEKLLRVQFLFNCLDEQQLKEIYDFVRDKMTELDTADEFLLSRPIQFSLGDTWGTQYAAAEP